RCRKPCPCETFPDLYFLVGLCARRFHDRRPALDILAHEGREFLACVTDSRRAFGLELLTQSRLSQRSNDRRMEFLGDCVRQARRREYPEPGGGFKSRHHLPDSWPGRKHRLGAKEACAGS